MEDVEKVHARPGVGIEKSVGEEEEARDPAKGEGVLSQQEGEGVGR